MPAEAVKINIGCGLSGIPGWHNIDNSPTIPLSRIPFARRFLKLPDWPRDVRRYDVRKGLPYSDASVQYIYSSHTFEHFTWDESLVIARECFRVLVPGGILRIVVPDLAICVREYTSDRDALASHHLLNRLSLRHTLHDALHPGSNHSQMFDARSLTHLLQLAGFSNPEVCEFQKSAMPEVVQLDLEVRRRESLYVEAKK
jgi:predicted SAM-dependent methyltransferase